MSTRLKKFYDVIVIGAGPAASAAATILAKENRNVLVLEKDEFPRYQVGESLLPSTWRIFKAMGVTRKINSGPFMKKPGATYLWGNTKSPWTVTFEEVGNIYKYARNVERSIFDKILIDHASECGAVVKFSSKVKKYLFKDKRVVGVKAIINGKTTDVYSDYVVDTSGRNSKLSDNLVHRFYSDDFRGAAIWSYFKDVKRLPKRIEGNIIYAMFSWGWFWLIPLHGNKTSVGVVMNPSKFRKKIEGNYTKEKLFLKALEDCDYIRNFLTDAQRVDIFRSCADYSFNSERYYYPGVFFAGDSACFIDPVLSTGVHLAMYGGYTAGLALNTIFRGGNASECIETFEESYRQNYDVMLKISQQQYDLNRDQKTRFWQAHKILKPSLKQHNLTSDRLAFINVVAGFGDGTHEAQIAAVESRDFLHSKYAIAKYSSNDDFLSGKLSTFNHSLVTKNSFKTGSINTYHFTKSKKVLGFENKFHEVSNQDLHLLELCSEKRDVKEVLNAFKEMYNVDENDFYWIREQLGRWIESKLLRLDAKTQENMNKY